MTKFEEEVNKYNIFERTVYLEGGPKKILIDHFKNWHSDEEFQAKEKEIERLRKINHLYKKAKGNAERLAVDRGERLNQAQDELASLESQLQQHDLPVVPEFVAEWIEYVKEDGIFNALALLDKDEMPEGVNEWLFLQSNDDNINLILRAWLDGYTVEKPQLFYLKHIDFCKTDKHYDWFTIKHSDGPLNHLRVEKGQKPSTIDCKFTQQEIDSMETGSYEKIEVHMEDGE